MSDVSIRLVERRDAAAIRDIYNLEVTSSTVTFDLVPRTLDEQVAWIDEHSGGHPATVAIEMPRSPKSAYASHFPSADQ